MRAWNTALTLALTLLLGAAGCDSDSGDATPAPQPDADAVSGDTTPVEDTAEPDAVVAPDPTPEADAEPPEPDVVEDTEPTWDYPEGPYGTKKFEIIADISFWEPFEGRWLYLHEYYNDPAAKVLLLSSAAGWCGPCQFEAEEFKRYFAEHEADGLRIIYALFEDEYGQPLFRGDGSEEYSQTFMEKWKATYAPDYTLVADANSVMHDYYTEDGVPMAMFVTIEDMRIRSISHGYSEAFVEYEILKHIYN